MQLRSIIRVQCKQPNLSRHMDQALKVNCAYMEKVVKESYQASQLKYVYLSHHKHQSPFKVNEPDVLLPPPTLIYVYHVPQTLDQQVGIR